MRRIALIVAGFGIVLVAVAALLLTNEMATPERKAAFAERLANPENLGLDEGQADTLRAAVMVTETLTSGIFFAAPIDLAELLPPAPEGWTVQPYDAADGTAITGETVTNDLFGYSARQETLRGLAGSQETPLDLARTYRGKDGIVTIWLHAELDTFRHLKTWEGEAVDEILAPRVSDPDAPVLAHIEGLALRPRGKPAEGQKHGRLLFLDIGRAVDVVVLTNASDAELEAVLMGLDPGPLQAILPRPTEGYQPGAGFVLVEVDEVEELPAIPEPG